MPVSRRDFLSFLLFSGLSEGVFSSVQNGWKENGRACLTIDDGWFGIREFTSILLDRGLTSSPP